MSDNESTGVVFICVPDCEPCEQLKPVFESCVSARPVQSELFVADLSSREDKRLLFSFRVKQFPTVLGLIEGQEIDRWTGVSPDYRISFPAWYERLVKAISATRIR